MTKACEANKSFLQSAVDKKEYSRTLLVDDGSDEGARSAGAFRPTPHRKGHGGRSPRRDQSPRRDSPQTASRTRLSSELIADLLQKKRERPTRSSSFPKRDKTIARTDRSPRSSPLPRSMGPPPPVIASPSSRSWGERPVGVQILTRRV
ncbi:myosin heavy chain-like protein [Arabidopsis thaliana]|uniref:Myosin heavy chain-like protein n=1 Tax=Arabidopsis thaliana TaxID=3702 RepID=Q3EAT4_ARATH|nr:myosin heavy chain-like protein [Arabidopsis thaliana]AEE77693.1 myosin heavy chain-like protein [Arabidopsis thaliana]|eukprot:NP_189762.1 myosin heavy chain-like protein [Arabidopsis thaliana]